MMLGKVLVKKIWVYGAKMLKSDEFVFNLKYFFLIDWTWMLSRPNSKPDDLAYM